MKYRWGRKSFRAGTTNTICDETGAKVKMSQVRRRWDGAYVIPEVWEPRDPQDFPVKIDAQKVFPNARPPKEDPIDEPSFDLI